MHQKAESLKTLNVQSIQFVTNISNGKKTDLFFASAS